MVQLKTKAKKPKVVAVSGGFDPLHIGHVRMMQEAKKLGDKLVVILNNDNWLKIKKGQGFMPETDRKEIIEAIGCVDEVVITSHASDFDYTNALSKSVCAELAKIKPHVFANGGDRFADDIPEFKLCRELGIEMIFNVGHGGKVRSSSSLLADYSKKVLAKRAKKPTKVKKSKSKRQ